MTTKTISTYVAGGYVLLPNYSELDITASGGVAGVGVHLDNNQRLSNAGRIDANDGIYPGVTLLSGDVLINRAGGYIGGYSGVISNGVLALTNEGTISGARYAILGLTGGSVVNGDYLHPTATIGGGEIVLAGKAAGTVSNFGTISSFILLADGGSIINGGIEDTTALMNGGGGLYVATAPGTVSNFGTIQTPGGAGVNGINLGMGGRVANGAASDTTARIDGFTGVLSASGTVANFGLIRGAGASAGAYGVFLNSGGAITNGTSLDTGARIEGYTAIGVTSAAGTVVNFATIAGMGVGPGQYGVLLKGGGSVTNGGGNDHVALIEGADGVAVQGGASATVKNFGTILASGAQGVGVLMNEGALTNGSLNNVSALIDGYYTGAVLLGSSVSTNFGTIAGYGDTGGFGVRLENTASLVNGATGHQGAIVRGFYGIDALGSANTVTNFGTILGTGGTALALHDAADALVVEAGCAFVGAVTGGGGLLVLDSGVGKLAGLFSSSEVTVSGSMAATTFADFATVEIGAAASFTGADAVTLASGQTLVDAGSLSLGSSKNTLTNGGLIETTGAGNLTIKGALKNTSVIAAKGGVLTVIGAVSGLGSASIDGGVLDTAGAFTQNVSFTGTTGVLELAQSQGYTGSVSGFSKSGKTSLDLRDVSFGGGTTASFSGTSKSGILTITDGAHTAHITLKGNYTGSTFIVSSDGAGGTLVVDPNAKGAAFSTPASPHAFAAAASALAGPAAWLTHAGEARGAPQPMLSRPRTMTV